MYLLDFGPALIEHVLLESGFSPNLKVNTIADFTTVIPQIRSALVLANDLMNTAGKPPKVIILVFRNCIFYKLCFTAYGQGVIVQKLVQRSLPDGSSEDFYSNEEYHPLLFHQHTSAPHKEMPSFNAAVDEFFSNMESQKLDLKAIQQV